MLDAWGQGLGGEWFSMTVCDMDVASEPAMVRDRCTGFSALSATLVNPGLSDF